LAVVSGHTQAPMTPEQLARIRELPALIKQEKDLEKMIALASELADLLEIELKEAREGGAGGER
jgi:hypothetical protein